MVEGWEVEGIDPFMSLSIFVYAPTLGVHTNDAIEFVVSQWETFLKQTPKPSKAKVLAELKRIGALAQTGKLGK